MSSANARINSSAPILIPNLVLLTSFSVASKAMLNSKGLTPDLTLKGYSGLYP